MNVERKPYFVDTTLRDGEQAPGVVFSSEDKLVLCDLLDKAGVSELEVGTPAMGEDEISDLCAIANGGFHFKRLAWARANEKDIRMATRSGANGLHISFPVSSILQQSMNKDCAWVMDHLREMLHIAISEFEYVTIGAQDAGRADLEFLKDFAGEALLGGAFRIRLADTVGILNPVSCANLVHSLHADYPELGIEMHAHNDLGMATANTVAAYLAGADYLSVTVNGLGERAGNAALEEVAMALTLSEKIDTGIDTELFDQLSLQVLRMSGREMPVNKPIVGDDVLKHESGIHINCLLKNRNTYQLFPARMIGREESDFVYGKHSGRSALEYFFQKHQITISDEECLQLLAALKSKSIFLGRSLENHELMNLYRELKKSIKKEAHYE